MKNKKIIALGGVILAIIAVVGLGFLANKDDVVISGKDSEAINEVVENNEADEDLPLISDDGVNLTLTEDNFETIKETMVYFQDGAVIKELCDLVYDERGAMTDIEVLEMTEYHMLNSTNEYFTLDTLAIYNDPEVKEDYSNWSEICNKHKVDTEKHFSKNVFDCKNLFDLSITVAEDFGIDTSSFVNSRLDKETYDRVYEEEKQKIYHCKIKDDFDPLCIELDENDYDKIISKNVDVFTNIDWRGNEYISFVQLKVEYSKNDIIRCRQLTLTTRGYDEELK